MTEAREQILVADFELVNRDQLQGEEFDANLVEMNADESKFLDAYFVEHLGVFARKGFEGIFTAGKPKTWRNHFKRIAAGNYPLDELPEHVRDRARELYYQ